LHRKIVRAIDRLGIGKSKRKFPFNANLNGWDPVVTNALALDHDIVLVNGAGIVGSSGQTPATVVEMAKHIGAFCEKLNLMIIWKQFEISSDQGKPE
jgi:hypothetical protein